MNQKDAIIYERIVAAAQRNGIPGDRLCKSALSVEPEQIRPDVILAPWWRPELFAGLCDSVTRVGGDLFEVWELAAGPRTYTYIRTGVGANRILDATLALGTTPCRNVVFIGSVAGLRPDIGIGDILIPEAAVCGDGACRYLGGSPAAENDCFGEAMPMDPSVFALVHKAALQYADSVRIHTGRAFSIDTIFAEFLHVDDIIAMGLDCLEMELAAFFRAAAVAGLRGGAVCSVSDNIALGKSLYYGRSEEEYNYRVHTRRDILTRIVLDCFAAM